MKLSNLIIGNWYEVKSFHEERVLLNLQRKPFISFIDEGNYIYDIYELTGKAFIYSKLNDNSIKLIFRTNYNVFSLLNEIKKAKMKDVKCAKNEHIISIIL